MWLVRENVYLSQLNGKSIDLFIMSNSCFKTNQLTVGEKKRAKELGEQLGTTKTDREWEGKEREVCLKQRINM